MYSATQYRSDLKRAWKPVQKSVAAFGRKLLKLDPFTYFGLCLVMCARFVLFIFQFALYTGRKLLNF